MTTGARMLIPALLAALAAGCCSLMGLGSADTGPRLEEKADGLHYVLDEIVPEGVAGAFYNPEDLRFAQAPRLDPLSLALSGAGTLPYDPQRPVPPGAQVIRHTAEVGFVVGAPRHAARNKSVTLTLTPPGAQSGRPVPVRFTVERVARVLHPFHLAYQTAALPWKGPLPPGVPPRPEGYFDPQTRWIARFEPAVRLPERERTEQVKVRAFVTHADFEHSGFGCPIELGRAIHAGSTPVFGELYFGLRAVPWTEESGRPTP